MSSKHQMRESGMQQSKQSSEMGQSMRGRSSQAGRQRQVAGEVVAQKTVDVRGTNIKHQIVHLKTQGGKRVIADLGSTRQLSNLDISEGDRISVQGRAVRVGNRLVLAANKVRANGETVQIDRNRQAQQLARQAGQGEQRLSQRQQQDQE
jgi:hypothetical protein